MKLKVDSHIVYGRYKGKFYDKEKIITYLVENNVELGILNNYGLFYDVNSFRKLYHLEENNKLYEDIVREENLGMNFFINPRGEILTNEVRDYIEKNKNKIRGLFFHPYMSQLHINHDKLKDYIGFAGEISIPITVNVSNSQLSNIKHLYEVSRKYDNVKFMAIYLDGEVDHIKNIMILESLNNIYVSNLGISYDDFRKIYFGKCSDRLLFSSGFSLFENELYKEYFKQEEFNDILNHNSIKFFNYK